MAGLTLEELQRMGGKPVAATPQTPSLISESTGAGPTFTPTTPRVGGFTLEQIQQMGGRPTQQAPQAQPVQAPQQIIQQGIEEPEQRVVGGKGIETAEDTGIFKRSLAGIINALLPTRSTDIVARKIIQPEAQEIRQNIIDSASKDIETYKTQISRALSKGDTERASNLEGKLVNTIEITNSLLDEDIFHAPTASQLTGAALAIGATVAAPFVPARLATTPIIGTKLGFGKAGEVVSRGAIRAAGGLGRASLETGLAAAPITSAFLGGETLAETGDIQKASVSALIGAPLGFAGGAVLPPVMRGLGLFGTKVIKPIVNTADELTGGKLSNLAIRGLIKPLSSTLKKIGLTDISDDLMSRFTIRKELAGKAQLAKVNALKYYENVSKDIGEEAAHTKLLEALHINGNNSQTTNAPFKSLEELSAEIDDPVIKEFVKLTYAVDEVGSSVVSKFGKVYSGPKRPDVEGAIILPKDRISANELEDMLFNNGIERVEARKIVNDLQTKVGYSINKEATENALEFTDMPKVAVYLEKNLPKLQKIGEVAPSAITTVTEVTNKVGGKLLKTTEPLAVKAAPRIVASQKTVFIEGEKLPTTRIKRQAVRPAPRLVSPTDESGMSYERLIKYVEDNDPSISKITDPNKKRELAVAKLYNEEVRGIDSYSTRGIASSRTYDFATPNEAMEAGWLPRNKKEYGDLLDAMIDQNLDDAAKYEGILKYVDVNKEGTIKNPEERLRQYVDDIIKRVSTKATTQFGREESRKQADFVRSQLESIIGIDKGSEINSTLSLVKELNAFKLTTSAVANFFQPLNSLLAADMPSFSAGIKSMLNIGKSPISDVTGREFGILAGARAGTILETGNVLRTDVEKRFYKKFLDKLLKPFKMSEIDLNRTHAANTGAFYVMDKFKNGDIQEMAKYLGFDRTQKAIARGFLNDEDLIRAGTNFMDYTQFGFNPLELPTAFSDEYGSVVLQFKSFGYRQAKFVIKEALSGDQKAIRNIAILSLVYPPMGQAQEVIKRIVSGKALTEGFTDEDASWLGWYIEGALNTGIMSIIGEAIQSGTYAKGVNYVAGPTLSTIGGAIDITGAAVQRGTMDAIDETIKLGLGQFGGGGRGIYNLGKWLIE